VRRPARMLLAIAAVAAVAGPFAPSRALATDIHEWCSAGGYVDVSMNRATGIVSWTVNAPDGGCNDLYNLVSSCDDPYGCGSPPAFTISGSGTSKGVGLCDKALLHQL